MAERRTFWLDDHILHYRLKDKIAIDEMIDLYEKAISDPATSEKIAILVDGQSSTSYWSTQDIERISSVLNK